MHATTRTALVAAACLAAHSADAFTVNPTPVCGAARSLSGSVCLSQAKASLPLAHQGANTRARAASALTLRAKDEFAEGAVAGGFSNKGEAPFEIRGFSLATVVLGLGLTITIGSFYSYFTNGNSVTSLGFVYGLPITLGGFSLKYAEILPVPVKSSEAADALYEEKATETLRKIRTDVTRHRYGDDAHLDTTLEKLGLVNPGKKFPQMQSIDLSVEAGKELGYSMVFQSIDTPYKVWADPARLRRYETFFGPGVNAEVVKVSKEERLVAIKLVTGEARKGTGAAAEEDMKVSAGGATKMGAEEGAPKAAEEDKRSMEV